LDQRRRERWQNRSYMNRPRLPTPNNIRDSESHTFLFDPHFFELGFPGSLPFKALEIVLDLQVND
jgi:hypothetical protein